MNFVARSARALMRYSGNDGTFCIGRDCTYYEWNGLKFVYHFDQFGTGGNIDSGGNTEITTISALRRLLDNNDVFYDVGSHEGLFSIAIGKSHPKVKIYSFEPFPDALYKNLELNGVEATIHPVAVGDLVGRVNLTNDRRSSNFVCGEGVIEMTTLDDLRIDKPDAIKLDIEGYEFQALKGATKVLKSRSPIIVTEINDCLYRYHQSPAQFFSFMRDLEYTPYFLNHGKLSAISEIPKHISDLPYSADSNYWWMKHQPDISL